MMNAVERTRQTSQTDYDRVDRAIRFLEENRTARPSLDELAEVMGLSPHHCHRLFSRWVGTTPKRFLQVLTAEHAKQVLAESRSVLDAAFDAGIRFWDTADIYPLGGPVEVIECPAGAAWNGTECVASVTEERTEVDVSLAKRWTRETGVASIPLTVFCEQPFTGARLRFCFAKDDATLERAAEKLCKL